VTAEGAREKRQFVLSSAGRGAPKSRVGTRISGKMVVLVSHGDWELMRFKLEKREHRKRCSKYRKEQKTYAVVHFK